MTSGHEHWKAVDMVSGFIVSRLHFQVEIFDPENIERKSSDFGLPGQLERADRLRQGLIVA